MEVSLAFRTLLNQELIKNGVIMSWISFSLAHKEEELELTLNALNNSLLVYKDALTYGIENYLEGPIVKPVFRKFN
jgi:glutamate-1-semialdehyde 2,1-aminomutase